MEEFISRFIEEARSLLFQLESDLLLLEQEPENAEIINSIFRAVHTIKGAASMYGYTNMQNLTHEFESIYDRIRDKKLKVTTDIIDETLKGKDLLLAMLNKDYSEEKNEALINTLKEKYLGSESQKIAEINHIKDDEIQSALTNYCILLCPDIKIFERGVDPDVTLKEISQYGIAKIILHERKTSWIKQKSKKVCHTSWEIYLQTNVSKSEIESIFLFYDQDEYRLIDFTDAILANDATYLAFIKEHYKDMKSIEDHLKSYLNEFVALDHTAEIKNAVHNSHGPGEQKSSDSSKVDMDATINVSSHKLDELLNLVSELVTSTASLETYAAKFKDLRFTNTVENIEKLTKRFRNNALDLRLLPVGTLLEKFNRHVRDLSKELNKKVNLIVEGHETEIDKTILKSIESPLLHIIRNSMDHGIEPVEEREAKGKSGTSSLKIVASYSGANVILQVQDDGRGINLEKVKECAIKKGYIQPDQIVTNQDLLNLIMEPGFSTSDNISMVSGRGVGMDVVRKQLNAVSGSMEINTEKDLGTIITMKLPTTLSIIDTLMIEVNKSQLLIPLLEVEYCYQEKHANLMDAGNRYVRYKNDMVPFISLREKFKYEGNSNDDEMVIIINKFEKKYAIIVDYIVGEHQAVIKPLGELFISQPYFSGGSVMVDGKLALILDTNYLFNQVIIN